MNFNILLSDTAQQRLADLAVHDVRKHQKVLKTLGLMETNIRHQSLQAHKYSALRGPNGEEIFEAYVENKTPAAYRVFWYYGPKPATTTILAITPHP